MPTLSVVVMMPLVPVLHDPAHALPGKTMNAQRDIAAALFKNFILTSSTQ
jgi:hypothetical protein